MHMPDEDNNFCGSLGGIWWDLGRVTPKKLAFIGGHLKK